MGRIASALDAHRALMFVPEMKSGREFWAAHDIDPGMMAGYAEYYCHRDLWALRGYDSLTNPGSTSDYGCKRSGISEIRILERFHAADRRISRRVRNS